MHRKYGEMHEMFVLGDEFTSIVTNVYLVRLYERLGHYGNEKMLDTIKSELKYRKNIFRNPYPETKSRTESLSTDTITLRDIFIMSCPSVQKEKPGTKPLKTYCTHLPREYRWSLPLS